MKIMWFVSGMMAGLAVLSVSMASIPKQVPSEIAHTQDLSEIRVEKTPEVSFDSELEKLSHLESQYKEKLPSRLNHPKIRKAAVRVQKKPYSENF